MIEIAADGGGKGEVHFGHPGRKNIGRIRIPLFALSVAQSLWAQSFKLGNRHGVSFAGRKKGKGCTIAEFGMRYSRCQTRLNARRVCAAARDGRGRGGTEEYGWNIV